jgi:hypothetical protein
MEMVEPGKSQEQQRNTGVLHFVQDDVPKTNSSKNAPNCIFYRFLERKLWVLRVRVSGVG